MTVLRGFKPSQLPDLETFVAADTETSGLHPDDGGRVAVVSAAWHTPSGKIESCAFPFWQGLYEKPDVLEKADFGWKDYVEGPEVHGYFKNGKPRSKKIHRKWTIEEKMEALGANPNLGPEDWAILIEWLLKVPGLVWHNALFDLVVMYAGTPDFPGVDLLQHTAWDTMLGQRALDPEHPLALKDTAERLFDRPPTEQDALKEHLKSRKFPTAGKNVRYDYADWDVMEEYAAVDTEDTIQLARHQWHRFSEGESSWDLMHHNMDVMAALTRMEQRGVPYKAEESLVWAEKLDARIAAMVDGFPFNPTAPQATEFFFGQGETQRGVHCLGLKPVKLTGNGNASLDGEVVDELAARDVPWAKEYREYGMSQDAVGRYYRGYAEATGEDGRLRTRFRQTGTRAGRLSCERVNLQAIPHDHRLLAGNSEILAEAPSPRALIEIPEGYRGFHMDLAQAELRVAALEARCEPMLQYFHEGRDPHGETAIGLGLTAGKDDPDGMDWYKARSVIGKRSNFSLVFGIGPKKFREDLRKQSGIDFGIKKVTEIHKDWNALYPEFSRAIKRHMYAAEKQGWTPIKGDLRRYYTPLEMGIGPDGRRLQYNDLHKAFNQRVQGLLGWFGQYWLKKAERHLLDAGLDEFECGLLLQIHDALMVMVPVGMEHLAEECAQIARDMWVEWFPDVPGGVDVEEWNHK
jgi:DNA polymerase I-like protein with 3'-5' exonuclease and polymerase domains